MMRLIAFGGAACRCVAAFLCSFSRFLFFCDDLAVALLVFELVAYVSTRRASTLVFDSYCEAPATPTKTAKFF